LQRRSASRGAAPKEEEEIAMGAQQEDERYRLSFRGELLDGQDPATVRERVAALLKLDAGKAEALFSGRPVVLKRDADRQTAAKYQAAFRNAGAKLRVERAAEDATDAPPAPAPEAAAPRKPTLAERLAAQAEPEGTPPAPAREEGATSDHIGREEEASDTIAWTPTAVPQPEAGAEPARPEPAATPSPAPASLTLAPVGADLLAAHERPTVEARTIEVDHLQAEVASLEDVSRAPAPPPAPDVSHLSLDVPGALLVAPREIPVRELDLSSLTLAEAGADLPGLRRPPPVPVEVPALDVAEPGATLGPETAPAAPPPPDTDHLELVRERARFDVD
jgi:hypothetical protein